MEISRITVTKDEIVFSIKNGKKGTFLLIRETVPIIGKQTGRQLSQHEATLNSNDVLIPRFSGKHDRIYSEFAIYDSKTQRVHGVKYVTNFEKDVPTYNYPYPQPTSIKALGGTPEDIKTLGLHQTLININLPAIMSARKTEHTMTYEHNGREYYFWKHKMERIDNWMREMDSLGLLITMILLNSPRLFDSTEDNLLLDSVIHPKYDWECDHVYISAFNMETEEGQNYYRAFVEFLAERYSREDKKYGRACGMIISNEIDSQYVWGNAGEMTCNEYTKEYTQAMRLAWICARKHYKNFRIYVSLDHYFCNLQHDPSEPLRYYSGREVLENINKHATRDGNFDWNIAYHPYPENLAYPDFWNDRSVDFTFSTNRITFKNIEVLPAFLSQEQFLYNGQHRRIILSEQGFNSRGDSFTELQGAMGYCLAYLKIRQLPTVDMFTHHAYVDNPHEFGLNLGIRRYDPNTEDHVGEAKPIYYVIRDMDTPAEENRIQEARQFIGEELFDSLLHPRITYGNRDASKDKEFFGANKEKEENKL